MVSQKKAIVIGSGVAGLAAAIRLSVKGFKVTVYEKNESAGGKISAFTSSSFHFDKGPSLFTQPENIEELFRIADEPIEEYFNYIPVDNSCTYFFENGKVIRAFTDKDRFASELQEQANEPKQNLHTYLSKASRLYSKLGYVFLNRSLHKRATWFQRSTLNAFLAVRYPYIFSSLSDYNKRSFKSPEARLIFNRYATYNGSNPFKAPAMLSVISHLELNLGTYYPKGGMISIANALYQLALKKGVQFKFNTTVDKIIHHEGTVHGVVVNKSNELADVVISNGDVYFTYMNLLGYQQKAKKLLRNERSSSALIFYWGMNKTTPAASLHNIIFSDNYKEEFNCIFNKKTLYKDPTIYINITSRYDVAHAPLGKENWFVMINVPANYGQNWEKLRNTARENVIAKISRVLNINAEEMIETEEYGDPVILENTTGSFMGSLYGNSSNSKMAAFSRPANFTSFAKNLYFCGGTVHPGGGIPLCLNSAKITTELICKDLLKETGR